VVDVDALMDSLSDEQFKEWRAIAIVDGWWNGWSQTTEIIASIQHHTNREILSRVPRESSAAAFKEMDWPTGYEIAKKLTDYSKSRTKRKQQGLMSPRQYQKHLERRS